MCCLFWTPFQVLCIQDSVYANLNFFVAVSDRDSPAICHAMLPPASASTACCHPWVQPYGLFWVAYSSGFSKGSIALLICFRCLLLVISDSTTFCKRTYYNFDNV